MDDDLDISLFRHGLTKWNEKKAYIGSTDLPLSEKGKSCIDVVTNEDYQIVFSSPMKRCLQTTELLFPNRKPTIIPELKEIDFGTWEGKTYNELKNIQEYRNWLSYPYQYTPPYGESMNDFEKRVEKGWRDITSMLCEKTYTKVAIMTHGGIIRQLLASLSQEPSSFFNWDVPPGGGYRLIWKNAKRKGGHTCTLLREVPIMEKLAGSKRFMD